MLSAKMAQIILTVYPELDELKRKYAAKIGRIRSFGYNSAGRDAERVFDEYIRSAVTLDGLKKFGTTLDSALGLLGEEERAIIGGEFFEGKEKEAIILATGLKKSAFKYIRGKALKKIRVYVEMLGFDEETILDYFNEEPAFIDAAEEVAMRFKSLERFSGSGKVREVKAEDAETEEAECGAGEEEIVFFGALEGGEELRQA